MIAALALLLSATPEASAEGGLRFGEIVVQGKIQKPEIQILITKQNLAPRYELDLKESFLPKVAAAVKSKPF